MLKRTINNLRRSLMRKITRRFGVTRIKANRTDIPIRKILICRPNHRLGNLLLITPLLQEVGNTFPEASIDLFVKGSLAPQLFRNYSNLNRIICLPKKPQNNIVDYLKGWMAIRRKHYDLVINVIHSSSSGKIAAQFASGRAKFLGEINEAIRLKHRDYQHMAKMPVYSFRSLVKILGIKSAHGAVPSLDLKLTEVEVAEGRRLLLDLLKNGKQSIGIYTYATGEKRYPSTWWNAFYRLLKEKFPEHNILEILPIENVSQIAFSAPSFYSKDLRQIGSLISNLIIFIGADSGMMHLASASGTPVIGLFKAENMNQYAPYNHKSVGIHTEDIDQREIVAVVEELLVKSRMRLEN